VQPADPVRCFAMLQPHSSWSSCSCQQPVLSPQKPQPMEAAKQRTAGHWLPGSGIARQGCREEPGGCIGEGVRVAGQGQGGGCTPVWHEHEECFVSVHVPLFRFTQYKYKRPPNTPPAHLPIRSPLAAV